MSRRELARLIAPLAAVAVAVALGGCGKADLHGAERQASPAGTTTARGGPSPGRPRTGAPGGIPRRPRGPGGAPRPAPEGRSAALPLPLTAAVAARFAAAVALTRADIAGASEHAPAKGSRSEAREAARCGGLSSKTIGGGRSQTFVRGKGLDRESFSSVVLVLPSELTVRRDLQSARSGAGVGCYARVLRKHLQSEEQASVRVLAVRVDPLTLDVPDGSAAAGIRIAARVGVQGTRLAVWLYSDVISVGYGPSELQLYTTTFVQPAPMHTEQQLLSLMRDRARLSRL